MLAFTKLSQFDNDTERTLNSNGQTSHSKRQAVLNMSLYFRIS